jgi:hemerythrin
LDSCGAGAGADELWNTLEFLNSYIIKHFSDEEKLMRFYKYSDFERHRGYHEEFKRDVRELTNQLLAEGPTEILVGKVTTTIVGWLLNHIKGDDFKFASSIVASVAGERK